MLRVIINIICADHNGIVLEHWACDEAIAGLNRLLLLKKLHLQVYQTDPFSVGVAQSCYCEGMTVVIGKIQNKGLSKVLFFYRIKN